MAWLQKLSRSITSLRTDDSLQQFHRTWQGVQTTFSESPSTSRVTVELAAKLDQLLSLLICEASTLGGSQPANTATGPCFEYLLKNDLLSTLVSLATSDDPPGSLKLTVKLFSDLIAAMHDTFLAHANVHKALLKLLRACVLPQGELVIAAEYELDLVDLMATVSGRIKACPDLLPIFFRPPAPIPVEGVSSPTPSQASSHAGTVDNDLASPSQQTEFLLFSLLLRFVHAEGQTGDLARLGLLNLIQVAFTSSSTATFPLTKQTRDRARSDQSIMDLSSRQQAKPSIRNAGSTKSHEATLLLAEWVLDSDFAEVLGAVLGALYGLLPSKLSSPLYSLQGQEIVPTRDFVDDELDMQSSTGTARRVPVGATDVDAEEVTAQRITFLSLLDFVQDVLEYSAARLISDREKQLIAANLRNNILSSINSIFLDAVLYPSVMESSVADGSALAVLTYLTDFLDTARRDGDLARVLLDYFVGDRDDLSPATGLGSQPRLKKRKSSTMMVIEGSTVSQTFSQHDYGITGERFSLQDILLQNLEPTTTRSKQSEVTQAAALTLLNILVTKQDARLTSMLNARDDAGATKFLQTGRHQPDTTEEEEDVFVYPSASVGPSKEPTPAEHLAKSLSAIESYVMLAQRIQYTSSADTEYSKHLAQAAQLVANHPNLHLVEQPQKESFMTGTTIDPQSSPLIKQLLFHVSTFFTHSPAFNLALTKCLSSLAADPTRSLEGWMVTGDSKSQKTVLSLYEELANALNELRQSEEVEEFDLLLEERRRCIELVDNLADALLEGEGDLISSLRMGPSATSGTEASANSSTEPSNASAHPFAAHYEKTARVMVLPPIASLPGFLQPPHVNPSASSGQMDDEEDSNSEVGWNDAAHYKERSQKDERQRPVSLSMVLDNMSVFEESLKELTALIQVRKACGIDAL